MRPGLTSWTTLNGRNNIDWDPKFEMSAWYIDNWSFLLDFKILLLTVGTVLKREGVSKEGHATRDTLLGSSNQTHANSP